LLRAAVRRFPKIDVDGSILIGDAPSDVAAGERFGVRSLQLGRDAADLAEAVQYAVRAGMIATAEPVRCGRG
jgi:histidinol phosphatase-like enzyme